MSDSDPRKPSPENRYSLSALARPGALASLALIAAILGVVAAAFAWSAGWFSPHRVDQTHIVNAFEADGGVRAGFRRNHAKGVCFTGWFDGNGAAVPFSRASLFERGRVPVFGRFSIAGPIAPDSPAAVHSMAINYTLSDGEVWRTAMVPIPVFVVRDPKSFYDQLVAAVPDPKTGKPDPSRMKAFLAAHPETLRAIGLIKAQPFATGFANERYNSLNTFLLVNAQGAATPVRWTMEPVDSFAPAPKTAPSSDPNYLFDALGKRVSQGPVRWHLIFVLGRPGDPTNDATLPWPRDRTRIDAGTLTVTGLQAEAPGNCRDINFDPMVLPSGIAPSDDPLLPARSAVYSADFTRREGEAKTPSPVQLQAGR
ncbi:MAG TPA: catalase family peroxidase [Rhizomicrobium sp.]|nr:catalase family peroxidase [Rhizomicrobium sp.]